MRIAVLQAGGWGSPASEDIPRNTEELAAWVDSSLEDQPADLVVLPELSTTPYFCCRRSERYTDWAEPIPGPATERFSRVAIEHRTTIVLPLFERGADGRTYNAAAVIGPDGALIAGHFWGRSVPHYRKCHIPEIHNPPDTDALENLYFAPGDALPVFDIGGVSVGVLICFDRWFPEAWRVLRAQGVQVVVVPMVAWGFVEGPYLSMLISRAVENGVFAVTCNRSATEDLDGAVMPNFGRSAVIGPDGSTVALAPTGAGQIALHADLDLDWLTRQANTLPLLKFRRSDLYRELTNWR